MAHPSRSPFSGHQASLLSFLPFTLYSVSSCNPFSILTLSSFTPCFLNIFHRICLLTLGYAFFISNSVATGVQSSILFFSFTYMPASSCSPIHIYVASVVNLPTRNPSCFSSSTPIASAHCLCPLP